MGNGVRGCFRGFREVDDLNVDGGKKRTEEYKRELADGDEEGDETVLDCGESHEGRAVGRGKREERRLFEEGE